MKKYFTIFSVIFICVLVGLGAIFIGEIKIPNSKDDVDSQNPADLQNPDQNVDSVVISCEDVTMFIDEIYSLDIDISSNSSYTLSFVCDTNAMTITNQKIYANKVGQFDVTVIVTTDASSYYDSFVVNVVDTITQVNATIYKDTKIVDKLFANEDYVIEFDLDSPVYDDFSLKTSENILQLTNIDTDNERKIKFSFHVDSTAQSVFEFCYRNFSKTFTYNTYKYIDNFNVNFSNSYKNNVLTLSLFNENFLEQANNDNFFNFATYEISTDKNSLPLYEVNILDENVAYIDSNKIYAKSEGTTLLEISALDGSSYIMTIPVEVNNVLVENILPKQTSVSIYTNETFDIEYTFSPIYAICDFEITSNGLDVDNNTISSINEGNYIVTILDTISKKNIDINVQVLAYSQESPSPYYYDIIFSESFMNMYNASFEDNTLTMYSNSLPVNIQFDFVIKGNYQEEISTKVTISTTLNYSISTNSNSVSLVVESKGNLEVTLTQKDDTENKIFYTFNIVIL